MEFVRAGLGLHSDDAGGALAGLRVVVLKGDLGFGDGVEVRVHDDDAQDGILVVGTVELKVGAREVLPIDLDLAAALRIFRGSVAETWQFLSAWREQFEIRKVAIQDRQIFDVLLVELDVHVCAVGLQLGNVAGDFDRLRDLADLQGGIHIYRRVGVYATLATS